MAANEESLDEIDRMIDAVRLAWSGGDSPEVPVPGSPDQQARLVATLTEMRETTAFAQALAEGELSAGCGSAGRIAESLRSCRDEMRELANQARRVAKGDYTQSARLSGQTSLAFGDMTQALQSAREAQMRTADELFASNQQLAEEVRRRREAERELTELTHQLRSVNSHLEDANDALSMAKEELREKSIRDPLTGMFNRRYLAELWPSVVARTRRTGEPLSLMIADLDRFKAVNDEFGHAMGDVVLEAFSKALVASIRSQDIACRIGGDEFVVVVIGSPAVEAERIGHRLLQAYADSELPMQLLGYEPSASIGVAEITSDDDLGKLLEVADGALYSVKGSGRGAVAVAPAVPERS